MKKGHLCGSLLFLMVVSAQKKCTHFQDCVDFCLTGYCGSSSTDLGCKKRTENCPGTKSRKYAPCAYLQNYDTYPHLAFASNEDFRKDGKYGWVKFAAPTVKKHFPTDKALNDPPEVVAKSSQDAYFRFSYLDESWQTVDNKYNFMECGNKYFSQSSCPTVDAVGSKLKDGERVKVYRASVASGYDLHCYRAKGPYPTSWAYDMCPGEGRVQDGPFVLEGHRSGSNKHFDLDDNEERTGWDYKKIVCQLQEPHARGYSPNAKCADYDRTNPDIRPSKGYFMTLKAPMKFKYLNQKMQQNLRSDVNARWRALNEETYRTHYDKAQADDEYYEDTHHYKIRDDSQYKIHEWCTAFELKRKPCPKDCSGHGSCDGKKGECTCDALHTGLDCDAECPSVDGNACNEHGKCKLADKSKPYIKEAMCTCDKGYKGSKCEFECPTAQNHEGEKLVCDGHGTCDVSVSGSGAYCACNAAWRGPACNSSCPGGEGNICNDHGNCVLNRTDNTAECDCADGRVGDACQYPCPSTQDAVCAGHGTCNQNATGMPYCKCEDEWVGTKCHLHCPTDAQGVCDNHGECQVHEDTIATCACNPPYTGSACQLVCPQYDGRVCNNHGECEHNQYNHTGCVCEDGYTGRACETPPPVISRDVSKVPTPAKGSRVKQMAANIDAGMIE